jgi:hypothetical protein
VNRLAVIQIQKFVSAVCSGGGGRRASRSCHVMSPRRVALARPFGTAGPGTTPVTSLVRSPASTGWKGRAFVNFGSPFRPQVRATSCIAPALLIFPDSPCGDRSPHCYAAPSVRRVGLRSKRMAIPVWPLIGMQPALFCFALRRRSTFGARRARTAPEVEGRCLAATRGGAIRPRSPGRFLHPRSGGRYGLGVGCGAAASGL